MEVVYRILKYLKGTPKNGFYFFIFLRSSRVVEAHTNAD